MPKAKWHVNIRLMSPAKVSVERLDRHAKHLNSEFFVDSKQPVTVETASGYRITLISDDNGVNATLPDILAHIVRGQHESVTGTIYLGHGQTAPKIDGVEIQGLSKEGLTAAKKAKEELRKKNEKPLPKRPHSRRVVRRTRPH